jgi:hypothetical protein
VLRRLLQHFDQRLSVLFEALWRWAKATHKPAACVPQTIIDFLEAEFGVANELAALARYMLGAVELRRRASLRQPVARRAPAQRVESYRLSEHAMVLLDLPDCPTILEHLVSGEPVPAKLSSERGAYLLYLAPGQDEVRNFSLTEASAALLRHLDSTEPEQQDHLSSFEQETGYPVPPATFLHALAERGLLVDASHVTTH